MATLENMALVAAVISLGLAVVFSLFNASARKKDTPGVALAVIGLASLTLSIISRWVQTGHGPFSNMYEFSVAFSWGIVLMGLFFQWRYRTAIVKTIGLAVAAVLLLFALSLPSKPVPLVPALQQSTLLSVHVASAVIAYGTFTIGFGAAVLYLLQSRRSRPWLPNTEVLDDISYQAVVIGFPFLTLLIVLGALWADVAWGRYWGWDPKETASLVTWLLYASYLHARVMRGWRGTRTAALIIIGFAAVLFTFFGNYIFTGLHAYN